MNYFHYFACLCSLSLVRFRRSRKIPCNEFLLDGSENSFEILILMRGLIRSATSIFDMFSISMHLWLTSHRIGFRKGEIHVNNVLEDDSSFWAGCCDFLHVHFMLNESGILLGKKKFRSYFKQVFTYVFHSKHAYISSWIETLSSVSVWCHPAYWLDFMFLLYFLLVFYFTYDSCKPLILWCNFWLFLAHGATS